MESRRYYERSLVRSILAGMAIGIGGCVFIGCSLPKYNVPWVGSILFAVGLCSVFMFGFDLYTGKVGYAVNNKIDYIPYVLVVILGNFIGAMVLGYIAPVNIAEFSSTLFSGKLEDIDYLRVLFKGILCGILMYIAVDYYKREKKFLAAMLCVPTFIMAGFEHSIADIFYFWAGFFGDASAFAFSEGLLFLLVVLVGNAIGCMLIPFCQKFMYEEKD